MVSLYLGRKPVDTEVGNDEDARRRREWLDRIGAALDRVLTGAEARMWLITSLSSVELGSLGCQVQVDCFLNLLRSSMRESARRSSAHGPLELQFMRLLIENKPGNAERLIKHDTNMFERLFSGHPKRILYWFDRFAGAGQTEHLLGARALANFAFRNRELCWHRLTWEGKHAHSPSTVAAKPHYFMELDVVNTVEKFLEYVPEFWRSKEFRDSLNSGSFWSIDMAFLAEHLAKKLDSDTDDAEEIWSAVRDYISSAPFSVLCQQLLHVVSDEKLLMLINDLGSVLKKYKKATHTKYEKVRKSNNWMEVMVYAAVQWESLMEPIFCNACIKNGRKLLRILQEEEHEEDANSLKLLMDNKGAAGDEGKEHWALRERISRMDKTAACRYVALEAWVLFYQLSSESAGADLYEALMDESGIQYRHREKVNARDKKKSKKSSKRSRRKRRRRHDTEDSDDDESQSDIELLTSDGLPKEEQGWLLSVDNYNLTWTKADLTEELTGVAVQTWFDWLIEKWL